MKIKNKAWILILCMILISYIAAAQEFDPEAHKEKQKVYADTALDRAESIKDTDPAKVKVIIRRVEEGAKAFGFYDEFEARIEALKKEVGYTKFDSIDFGNYVNPARHPVTWSISGVSLFGLFVLFLLIRKKKILGSMSQLKKTYSSLKKTKAMFEEIDRCIKDKEEHIKKNKEYLSRMINLVKLNSLPALFGKEATELTKNWAKEIRNGIIKKNRKIIGNVKMIQMFTEKLLPAEQGKLLRSLEEDANKIRAIEHRYEVEGGGVVGPEGTSISDQRKKFIDSISKVYTKNKEIRKALDANILPYQKKIVDYLSSIYASVVNEEKSVISEDKILFALSKKKIKGVKLKEALEELIIFSRRKIEYYEFQVKKHDEFMKLLQTDEQMIKWMKTMELAQESTLREADMQLRHETKTGLLIKKKEGRPLKIIRLKEKKYGKEVPREIWSLTELYDITGPDYIGEEAFEPLLIRGADENFAIEAVNKTEKEIEKIKREIKMMERRLRDIGKSESERKIIAPSSAIVPPEEIEDKIEVMKEELVKKEKYIESLKSEAEAVKHRNYPKSELNDIGTWLTKEWDHLGKEYENMIKPLGGIIGKLGPDKVNENRVKIKEYLERYIPSLKHPGERER